MALPRILSRRLAAGSALAALLSAGARRGRGARRAGDRRRPAHADAAQRRRRGVPRRRRRRAGRAADRVRGGAKRSSKRREARLRGAAPEAASGDRRPRSPRLRRRWKRRCRVEQVRGELDRIRARDRADDRRQRKRSFRRSRRPPRAAVRCSPRTASPCHGERADGRGASAAATESAAGELQRRRIHAPRDAVRLLPHHHRRQGHVGDAGVGRRASRCRIAGTSSAICTPSSRRQRGSPKGRASTSPTAPAATARAATGSGERQRQAAGPPRRSTCRPRWRARPTTSCSHAVAHGRPGFADARVTPAA